MAPNHRVRVQVCDVVAAGALIETTDAALQDVNLLLSTAPTPLNSLAQPTSGVPHVMLGALSHLWSTSPQTPSDAGRLFTEMLQLAAPRGARECSAVALDAPRVAAPVPSPSVPSLSALVLGTVHNLTLHRAIMDPHTFACLFSALPHAQSLESLALEEPNASYPWQLPKLECAWLAYAVFHPRAATSSWKTLVLRNCDPLCLADVVHLPHARKVEVLSATKLAHLQRNKKRKRVSAARADTVDTTDAGGATAPAANAAAHVLEPTQSVPLPTLRGGKMLAPRVVCVQANAEIRVQPDAAAARLLTIRKQTELELCHLWAGKWLCVLAPGFGFGWLHRSDVVETKRLPLPRAWRRQQQQQDQQSSADSALVPSLTALVLRGECLSMARTQLLVRTLGASLERLDLKTGRIESSLLSDIAVICPRLRTLEIKSKTRKLRGAALRVFFADTSVQWLRSLTLNWGICNPGALTDILSKPSLYALARALETLHICYVRADDFLDHELEFERALQRNDVLERVYLSGGEASEELRVLQRFDGETVAHEKMLRQRAAFLSVASERSDTSGDTLAVSRQARAQTALSVDLLRIVFAFALVQRVVGAWPPPEL